MTIRAQSADGVVHEFPDGTPDAVIDGAMQSYAREKAAPASRKRPLTGEIAGAMANFNRGLGIGDEMAAGFKTAGNIFSGKVGLAEAPQDFKRSMASQRQLEDEYAQDRPKAAALARGTGMAATVAVPAGEANLFAQGARTVNAVRGATVAGLQGAAYAAADRGTGKERLNAAARAARDPATLALGAVGGSLGPARPRQVRPVRPEIRALSAEGVQLTPGQMAGGAVQHIEDAATSLPILGPAISGARRRGVEGFNRAVLNRALRPIGEELPAGIQTGHEAIAHAGDRISAGYRAALPEGGVRADPGFTESVSGLLPDIQTLTPRNSRRLQTIVEERLSSRLGADGRLDGPTYQRVMGELENEAKRFSTSTDADEQAIGNVLGGIRGALRDAATRQNPRFGERIRQLNEAWANITRAETAAAAGKDPAGVFTPAQYDTAVKAGSDTVRRRGYARGEALGQDLSSAAKAVLPNSIADSGTATRGMVGMVLGSGGFAAGGPAGVAATAGGLAVGAQAYSPRAIELANAALARHIARADQQAAMRELEQMARTDPSAQRLYQQVAARLARAAGAVGAAPQAEPPANIFARP